MPTNKTNKLSPLISPCCLPGTFSQRPGAHLSCTTWAYYVLDASVRWRWKQPLPGFRLLWGDWEEGLRKGGLPVPDTRCQKADMILCFSEERAILTKKMAVQYFLGGPSSLVLSALRQNYTGAMFCLPFLFVTSEINRVQGKSWCLSK